MDGTIKITSVICELDHTNSWYMT